MTQHNQFGAQSTAEEVTEGIDMSGQTWLITGVNSGLGHESARVLASRGARLIGLARTREKAAEAVPLPLRKLNELDSGGVLGCSRVKML